MQIKLILLSFLVFAPLVDAQEERVPVPLVVRGDYVLTMDDRQPLLEDGAVVVVGERILRIGPWPEIAARYRAAEVLPGAGRIGTELACWEMIRGGTTSFVDMYFYPAVIAEVVERCGLRAIVAAPHIDFPSPGFEGWDDSFAAAIEFVTA